MVGQATFAHSESEIWLLPQWGRHGVDFKSGVKTVYHDPRTADAPTIIKSFDGGRGWQEHNFLSALKWDVDGVRNDGGVSLLRTQSGRLVYAAHRGAMSLISSGHHGLPAVAHSDDDGKSWSPMRILPGEEAEYYVMNQRLVQLASGRLLLPVCVPDRTAFTDEYSEGGYPTGGRFFYSDDNGSTWRLADNWLRGGSKWRGVQEPAVAELEGTGRLVCLFRSGVGYHQFSHSDDGGMTWATPQSTNLRAACSPLTLTKLPDGRLFVVYNPADPIEEESYFPRHTLAWATSTDGGAHWSDPVLIDQEPERDLIYASITPTDQGVLIVYASHHSDSTFNEKTAEERYLGGGKYCIIDGI